MSVYNEGKATRVSRFGEYVARDTGFLPRSTSAPLFDVIGKILITQIIGEVTTAIQDQANNTKLTFTPDGGAATDLCAVLNIANDGVGALYGITGTVANAMSGGVGAVAEMATKIVVGTGTINLQCAADNDGEVAWTLYYIPLEDGAYVTVGADVTTTTAGA
jgi:hypothetical protein